MTLALSCPPFAGVLIADVLRVSGDGARSIVQIGEDLRVRGVDLSSGDDLFDLVNPSGEEMLDLVDLPSITCSKAITLMQLSNYFKFTTIFINLI